MADLTCVAEPQLWDRHGQAEGQGKSELVAGPNPPLPPPRASSKLELEEPPHSPWGSEIPAPSGLKGALSLTTDYTGLLTIFCESLPLFPFKP